MTEEEAKQRWCPFARERAKQGMPDGGGNRTPYGCADDGPVEDDYVREQAMMFPCIGSACMAWRWLDSETKWVTDIPANETGSGEPIGHEEPRGKDRRGFCGLAGGKP